MNYEKILKSLSAINYWDKPPAYDLGFVRKQYLNTLLSATGNRLIKVIVGQRRCGKSYIIRQLVKILIKDKNINRRNIFYLNKEMFEFNQIATADDLNEIIKLYEETYQPKGKIYIFIDEVQNIHEWEKIIVSLAQHPLKSYEVFISGSNSKLLSGELATLLSGRYIVTEIFPFSYKEFLDFKQFENNKENFIRYISTSGLPELFFLPSDEMKHNYFQSLKNTILLKDIMYRHNIRDYALLEDIFLFLLHNVGHLTSIPSIIKYYKNKNRKVDYTTVSQYIAYMQDAFIIHEVPRFSFKYKELLAGEKKYYVNDIGFRNYLYPSLARDIGFILENVTYTHLRTAGYRIKIGDGYNYEVDFIAEQKSEKKYVQVSYLMPEQSTAEREFGALEKVKDSYPKYVISMDDLLISNEKGIIHKHIWDFIYQLAEKRGF